MGRWVEDGGVMGGLVGGGWRSYGWVGGWRMEELWVDRWVEDGGVMGGLVGGGWSSYGL